MNYVTGIDWVIGFLLIIFVIIVASWYVKKHSDDPLIVKYFKKGLYLKILGAVAFTIYHTYIYGGGDTFGYYLTGQSITKVFFTDPSKALELLLLPLKGQENNVSSVNWLWEDAIMYTIESNYFCARVSAFIQLFTFQSYVATCIVFSLLSFWGIWKSFKFFNLFFPNSEKIIALSFLFFPTVVFWGSGLGKDSLTLGAICGLVVCAYQVFIFKKRILKNSIGIVITLYILFIVKPYIPVSFLMPLAMSIAFTYLSKVKTGFGKLIVYPLVTLAFVGFGFLLFNYIQANFLEFGIDNITEKILSSNTLLQNAGSAFDLGINPDEVTSLNELIPFFPKAIFATCYRPWIFEAKNPAMLLSAIEASFLLILTVIILIRGYVLKTIKVIFSNSVLFSLFLYCMIFSGLIGLSTSNFGTLVRYKLPMMPFFVVVLLLTNRALKKGKTLAG